MRFQARLGQFVGLGTVLALFTAAPVNFAQVKKTRGIAVQVTAPSATAESWIGVWLQDVVDGGLQIVALVPGGPAELASLRVGDIILQGNSRPLHEQAALNRLLVELRPGEPLAVRLVRDGRTMSSEIVVATRPTRVILPDVLEPTVVARTPAPPRSSQRVMPRASPFWQRRENAIGIQVIEVTSALRVHYGAPEGAGVLVVRRDADGVAARSGIAVGDVIVRVGGTEVTTSREFEIALLRWGTRDALRAELVRDGKPRVVQLNAALETLAKEEQDGEAKRAAERELMSDRLQTELQRLERRMDELRMQLKRLENDD